MRRWVCIAALLFGFSGDSYAWTVRPRIPIPVERLLGERAGRDGLPEGAWWGLS